VVRDMRDTLETWPRPYNPPMLRGTLREGAAEFLGTFLILVFGTASVAQKILSHGDAGSALSIHLSWGLGVTMGIYASAGVSGAHLNPAVTLAFAAFRGFPWRKVPAYLLAQTAGAFAGAVVTFVTYREAFDAFDGGARQVAGDKATAGIFATYPQPFLSAVPGGFVDQVVGTALLLLVIFALGDRRNAGPASGGPVLVGALVVLIGMTFGFNAGYAINPARDFGPRLFTAMAGWGSEVFRAGGGWWWVPLVAPCFGGLLGGLAYDRLITRHHPPEA
jgi:MIP family channel proteins